ncbi:MAG: hypothetical protein J6O13_04285 [Selenomonas sp.]|uniref:hypothetical protein n=1 Tax=Selenomonas ruminantium TaxID=971 RepID=UPI001B22FBB1|nr:hypothetical protein [Selenomonas ruminantium]MBO5650901.1 hypothetical protein [Selenomonas sp.]MBO6202727.1 hypothetical protein [Selenomonas sp.]
MLITIGQLLAYTLVQTFGISIFTLSLYRLKKIRQVYRLKTFFYLAMVNFAGALTFGPEPWMNTSRPTAAGLFVLGIPFMLVSHLWLFLKKR